MKSVMYEWKKFRAFRYFWFLCSVFFLFNIWTLSEKMKMEMYDAGPITVWIMIILRLQDRPPCI